MEHTPDSAAAETEQDEQEQQAETSAESCSEQDEAERDAPDSAQDGDPDGEAPTTSAAAADQENTQADSLQHEKHEQDSAQAAQAAEPTGTVTHDHPPESTTGRDHHDDGGGTHRSNMTHSSGTELDTDMLSAQASSLALSSRPTSAIPGSHLRGSRPNSAAIAATIEGFETDFMGARDSNHMLDDVPEIGLGMLGDEEVTPEQLIAEKQQDLAILAESNEGLQQRARQVLDLRNKGRPAVAVGLSQLDGADTRYRAALKSWVDLRKEREEVVHHYQSKVFNMKSALEGRIQRAEEIANTLKHFKREVALAAEHSKSGKGISQKQLADLEARERTLEEEVQRVRLKNIHLANALKKLESTISHKEQLAEGLHLIDFEQLKIENQSLNEKIEERNEELVKLRKKTTVTVQILTHMKAKLAFIECENESLQDELHQLEAALAGKRDELASLKSTRDRLWQQQRQLKEDSVFVTNPMLLQDIQVQKEKRDDLMAEIELLKQQHAVILAANPSLHVSATGSRAASSPGQTAAASPGRLRSPLKSSSSKDSSVKLLVASAKS